MREIVEAMSRQFAPSGYEGEVRQEIRSRAEALGHSFRTDRLGNLYVSLAGGWTPGTPIYLFAHMDEPGLMVKRDTDGFWKFGLTGNTDIRTILGHQVLVGRDKKRGVIGLKPIHLTEKEEREKLPKTEDLYIDLGEKENLEPGEYGVFAEDFRCLGGRLLGKALSRSVTSGVLLALMKEPLPVDVTLVFTVQRHVGARGAIAAAAGISEGIAVVLDLCPGSLAGGDDPILGKGPVIPTADQGIIYDAEIQSALKSGAKRRNTEVQPWAMLPGKGDGAGCQMAGTGLRVGGLSCPARLMNAPCQMVEGSDMEGMARTLLGFLEDF